VKAFNCSGHGTSFGKATQFPKGTFKARTSKRIFSQFSVFRLGLSQKRMRRKWRLPDRKAILLRVFERPTRILTQSLVIPNGFIVRNLLSLAALPHSLPERFSRCGKHLEILWEAMIDGM